MILERVEAAGWSAGFGNLLAKELGRWWRTRRWLVHLVVWQVVITGLTLLVSYENRGGSGSAERGLAETMQIFFQAGTFFGLVGAVLVSQGAIVGERHDGTAAWVLTKPTTRHAFVLAKFVAIVGSFLILAVVLPAAGVLVVSQSIWGRMPELPHFLEAVGIMALHQTFYIAMALMLGTVFSSRGPVSGVALGFWFAGQILTNFAPRWLILGTPWLLANSATQIALWRPVPIPLWIPVVATAVLSVVFVAVALWRFSREEF